MISRLLPLLGCNQRCVRSCTAAGFTLIEVLVSLTLLTVVLAAVYGTFHSVTRALSRYDSVSLKYHETRSALDIMRREIEAAYIETPLPEEIDKARTRFIIKDRDIHGKPASELSLTAFSFRGSSHNRVTYSVAGEKDTLSLVKAEAPAALAEDLYRSEIIGGIESFSVETQFNNTWVRTWDAAATGRLPEIVRITIEFDDNGRTVRLTELARPRVGTSL
jgi:type II secretion system protein J